MCRLEWHYLQVAFLIMYGHLPSAEELANWDEALMRHSAIPKAVEDAVAALPHDAHFMGTVLTAINALSTCHPEQNPALAGQNVYQSKEMQDKQIVRLIGAQPKNSFRQIHEHLSSSGCILLLSYYQILRIALDRSQSTEKCCISAMSAPDLCNCSDLTVQMHSGEIHLFEVAQTICITSSHSAQ